MIFGIVVMWFAHKLSIERGLPIVLMLLAILVLVFGTLASSTMFGRDVYAIGDNMFELDAIAARFIGGASTTGGIGRLSGALIGGLIMAVMSNGMQLMGASTSTQQIVKGAVLLLAVAFDVWNKQRASA